MHFTIIGNLTRDVIPGGYTLGGTASYAGITARRLGADVTVVSRSRPEDAQHPLLKDVDVLALPSQHTTTFHNVYHNNVRTQRLRAVAGPILADDVPSQLYDSDIVLLAPLTQEVDPTIATRARGLVAATPQGWMREWDSEGQVVAVPWYSAGRVLPHLDVIIFSDEDLIGDLSILPTIIETVPVVAITKAAEGCVLYVKGERHRIPSRPAHEVDPTGAGDTFAAAFLVHYFEHRDPIQAAYFANATASMGIESIGTDGIPDAEQIQAYIQEHPLP
ncbi:MAG: hypothetical protein GXP37_15565 [Chloroflexi bacterium]|nr:hypothetical protein [Chloroflexota bacterium]